MTAMDRINAALAAPKTHRVITRYMINGIKAERHFDTRNAASAENYAIGERRKIGRDLIMRNPDLTDGPIIRVFAVDVEAI